VKTHSLDVKAAHYVFHEALLKDKDRFSFRANPHGVLEHSPVGEVHANAEDVGEPVFQSGHVEQSEAVGAVNLGDKVNVRLRRLAAASDGAVEMEMDYSSLLQLAGMVP